MNVNEIMGEFLINVGKTCLKEIQWVLSWTADCHVNVSSIHVHVLVLMPSNEKLLLFVNEYM